MTFVKEVMFHQAFVCLSVFDSDPGIFEGFFSMGYFFHSWAHISGKTDHIFMKILSQMYLWTAKSLLNFGSHSDPNSGFGLLIRPAFVLVETCALRMLLLVVVLAQVCHQCYLINYLIIIYWLIN